MIPQTLDDFSGTADISVATGGALTLGTIDPAGPAWISIANGNAISIDGAVGSYTLNFSGDLTSLSLPPDPRLTNVSIQADGDTLLVSVTGTVLMTESTPFTIHTSLGFHDPSIAIDPPGTTLLGEGQEKK